MSVLISLLLINPKVYSQESYSMDIIQTKVQYPHIKLFANFLDKDDNPIQNIHDYDHEITATIDDIMVEVESVANFNNTFSEGIGYIFVVDISKSLRDKDFNNLKEIIIKLINQMNENDSAAIITFGEEVSILQNYTSDKILLETSVNDISLNDNLTRFYDGIKKGLEIGRYNDLSLPDRRTIIVVSDGMDDFPGGLTKDEVIEDIKTDNIPIYAIGAYSPPLNNNKQLALDTFGEIARISNGQYYQLGTYDLDDIYNKIHNSIKSTHIIKLNYEELSLRENKYDLNLNVKIDSKVFTDKTQVKLENYKKNEEETVIEVVQPSELEGIHTNSNTSILYICLGIGLTLLLILVVIIYKIKKNRAIEAICPDQDNDDEVFGEDEKQFYIDNNEYHISGAKGKEIKLTIIDPKNEEKSHILNIGNKALIGRSNKSDLLFDDPKVSNKHCEIIFEKDNLYIDDLNSTNGTFVNGVPIVSRFKLSNNDIILIGQIELRINYEE